MIRALLAAAVLASAATALYADKPDAPAKPAEVNYHKHVAPILQKHCQSCHRPGEVGPFPLMDYKQAKRWAADIKAYTANRQMPPWMPSAGVPMKNERKMPADEIATLAAWADAGAPEGDPKDSPPPVEYPDGWRLGKPDLILTPSEDFHLAASGPDLFRCFVVPTGLTEHKWIVGLEVKPGNPRVVHHTLHFFDGSGTARELEKKQLAKDKDKNPADHGPGYTTGMGVGFLPPPYKPGEMPKFGGIGGWAPGQLPQQLPPGAGWMLPKGSDFLIQTHYHRDGKPGTDRTKVGLYFAKEPVGQPWQTVVLSGMKPWERIPAGEANHRSHGQLYLHTDAILHNVMPHMHLLGKSVKVTMTPPGGKPVVLVDIPNWDYAWQETYWFAEPITAKAGTKLEVEAVFDNSTKNRYNPSNPPKDVFVGEETTDEMLFAFFGATSTKTPLFEVIRFQPFPPGEAATSAMNTKGELTPVLEKRLGVWETTTVVKPSVAVATEMKITGMESVVKSNGGKFVRGTAKTLADNGELITLATYDPAKECYKLWVFDSHGMTIECTGKWDEKAGVLTFTAAPQEGVTATMRWKFPTADRFEWDMVVKSGDKALLDMSGVSTRKK